MSGDYVPPSIVVCTAWQRAGHYLWLPGMRGYPEDRKHNRSVNPWGIGPWQHLDSKTLHPATNNTGEALLTQQDGWTALGIEDRTCDSRPGSHSTFAIKGTYDFDAALALAREHFPQVISRIERVSPIMLWGLVEPTHRASSREGGR